MDITQDKTGFLWIATWDGLSRFDGYEFKNYHHRINDSTSIPNFCIKSLCCDSSDNLWMISDNNMRLSRYDRTHDNFIQYRFPIQENTSEENTIQSFTIDDCNNFWVLSSSGLELYDTVKEIFRHFGLDYSSLNTFIPGSKMSISLKKNTIWFLHDKKIIQCHFDPESKTIIQIEQILNIAAFYESPSVFHIYASDNNELLIHLLNGLFLFDPTTNKISPVTNYDKYKTYLPMHRILSQIPGKNLIIYDLQNQGKQVLEDTYKINLECSFTDRKGNIWYGCANPQNEIRSGLNEITQIVPFFREYNFINQEDRSITGTSFYGILEDEEDKFWICERSLSLCYYERKEEKITFYKIGSDQRLYPRSLVKDNKDLLWIGTTFDFLGIFNKNQNRIESILDDPVAKKNFSILKGFKVLCKTKNDRIIIGGNNGYIIFDPASKKIIDKDISIYNIRSIFTDPQGTIWIGTSSKLVRLDSGLKKKEVYFPTPENNYWIESICEGDSNQLWLALLGGGICRFDILRKRFYHYSTTDGLANNTTYGILRDNRKLIWVSTNSGISCFNPVTGIFRNFDKSDGLNIMEFNSMSYCKTKRGEMFFGGIGGLVSFWPESLPAIEENDHPLLITDCNVSGTPYYFQKAVYYSDTLLFDKGTDNFEFHFASLNFTNAAKILYRYKLEGFNDEWVAADMHHRTVNYMNLKPGKYIFKLESTGKSGDWKQRKQYLVIIPYKFYQHWFFKAGMSVCAVLVFFLLIYFEIRHYRFKTIQQETILKAKIKENRLDSLRSQMNPHFIFNALNSINYFISISDKLRANQYIADFSRLMRAILNNSSSEYIDMEKEIESLEDYLKLEHIRFGNKFDYSITIDSAIDINAYEVAPSMIQPFIENAIWHGVRYLEDRKGYVQISFLMHEDHKIICVVKDTGIGRKLSLLRKTEDQKKRKSRGITIIRERLEMFNAITSSNLKITIEDLDSLKEETGTQVTIEIPVKSKIL